MFPLQILHLNLHKLSNDFFYLFVVKFIYFVKLFKKLFDPFGCLRFWESLGLKLIWIWDTILKLDQLGKKVEAHLIREVLKGLLVDNNFLLNILIIIVINDATSWVISLNFEIFAHSISKSVKATHKMQTLLVRNTFVLKSRLNCIVDLLVE